MKYQLEIENSDITNIGIKSIIDFYKSMSIDNLQNVGTFAFVTGVPSPFLNVVIDIRHNRYNSNELLNTFNDFFDKYNMSWVWFINPASYENDLEALGFKFIEEAPAMYFDLSQQLYNHVTQDIKIQELYRGDDLKTWIDPIKEAYEAPEEDDSFRKLNFEILQKGSTQFKHFIAFQ